MELKPSDAEALVDELQKKRCAGADDLELMTWLSNRFRIAQAESRALYDEYYRGFQQGANCAFSAVRGALDTHPAPEGSAVYLAAYALGARSFAHEVEQQNASYQRRLRLHRVCWAMWIAGTIVIVLSWNRTVSPEIGWAGFAIACAGTVLSSMTHRPYRRR